MSVHIVYAIHNRGTGPHEGLRQRPACSKASTSRSRPARCSRCSVPTAPARRRPSASSARCSPPTGAAHASPATTWSSDRNAVREAISLTAQESAVDGLLTGAENLRMMARLRSVPKRAAAARASCSSASTSTDAADRRVATYSGGMRRRLDLAMSLISRPQVIFLDEPTHGPGPAQPRRRLGRRQALAADGATILLTTQYLEEADRLADRIAVVNDGRIAAAGHRRRAQGARRGRDARAVLRRRGHARPRHARCSTARPTDERSACASPPTAPRTSAARSTPSRRRHPGRPPGTAPAHPRRRLPVPDMTDSLTFIGRSLRHSVRSDRRAADRDPAAGRDHADVRLRLRRRDRHRRPLRGLRRARDHRAVRRASARPAPRSPSRST